MIQASMTGDPRGGVRSLTARGIAWRAGVLALVTIGAVALAVTTRRDWGLGPLDGRQLVAIGWDAWGLAAQLQQALVAMAMLVLAMHWTAIRRQVLGTTRDGDRARVFVVLVIVQLVTLGGGLVLEGEIELGFVVALAAGLLAGWAAGLTVGVVAVVTMSIVLDVQHGWGGSTLALIASEARSPSSSVFTLLAGLFAQPQLVALPWIGLAAGLAGDVLGRPRLRPISATIIGGVLSLVAGLLAASFQGDVRYFAGELLLPTALVGALSLGALGLVADGLRAESVRRRAERAETARVRAELLALRAQINPHFLFNALNTIRYFIREDPEAARRLLLDLSAVYQRAFRAGETIPLREELEHVEAYLALEKARLGERLTVVWNRPDAGSDTLDRRVPTLILQPLVENAVQHAVAPRREGGRVEITVGREADLLRLAVRDDGPGIPSEHVPRILAQEHFDGDAGNGDPASGAHGERPSIGLRNVDGRLRALYGDEHGLEITAPASGGTLVALTIPTSKSAASASSASDIHHTPRDASGIAVRTENGGD